MEERNQPYTYGKYKILKCYLRWLLVKKEREKERALTIQPKRSTLGRGHGRLVIYTSSYPPFESKSLSFFL